MMAKGHAYTGAIAGVALATALGYPLVPTLAMAVFVAGCALGPDWDHPEATAARTFGLFGKLMSEALNSFSALIYNGTKTNKDHSRSSGHRTLSHTILFSAIIAGALGGLVYLTPAGYSVAALLFIPLGFKALRFSMSASWAMALIFIAATTMFAPYMMLIAPCHLGLFVFAGFVAHLAGDCLTNSGAPLLFPVPLGGQRWRRFRTPARFDTGGHIEERIITPIIGFILLLALAGVLWLRISTGAIV